MQNFRRPFFRKAFFSYTVIVILSLLFILAPTCWQISCQDQQALEKERADKAELLVSALDGQFADMEQIGLQLSSTSWVTKVSSNSEILERQVDYLTRQDICKEIARYHGLIRTARSVALLLPQKDIAIDRYSFWETDRYFASIGIDETDFWEDFLEDSAESSNSLQLYTTDDYSDGFFAFRKLDYNSEPKQILFFAIDSKQLAYIVQQSITDTVQFFQITQGEEPIFTTGQQQEGDTYFTASYPSEIYPWSYTFQIQVAYPQLNSSYLLLLLSALLALTAGILLALLLASVTSKPLYALLQHIGCQPSRKGFQEFTAIEYAFHNLEESSQQYYNRIRDGLLTSLLYGSFHKGQIEADLTMFHFPFRNDMWYTLVLADSPGKLNEATTQNCLRLRKQFCPESGGIEMIFDTDHSIVVIMAAEKEPDRLFDCASAIREELRRILPAETAICITPPPRGGISSIAKMYREARSCTERDLGFLPRAYYPIDMEIQLINQLRLGNGEAACEIIRSLQRKNEALELSLEEIHNCTRYIFRTMMRVASDVQVDTDAAETEFLLEILPLSDTQRAWNYLGGMAYLLCREIVDPARRETQDIGRKMVEYVQARYCDSSLSQQDLADQFQLSRSAVSKIFKNAARVNFIDYLHLLRVQKAKEYFDAGATNILEIARKTGYENDITFKRAFQRVESVTPKKYIDAVRDAR